jgi:hypothetical protein
MASEAGGDRGRGVRGAERIVVALGALGETGEAAGGAQRADAVAAAGQDLVRVGLVADVPDQAVARRVEGVVDRGGEFHDAEAGAKVAAGYRNGVDGFLAEFVGDLPHLLDLELAQIVGRADGIEKRRFAKCGHCDIQFCMSGRTARRETGSALTAPRKSRLRCHPGGPVPDLKA